MKLTRIIVALVISLLCLIPTVSAYSEKVISLEIDGTVIRTEVPPTVIGGRTMVPVRDIFEACGANVTWDPATKKITGSKGGKNVVMQVGSNKLYMNSSVATMDCTPVIIEGRTLAPARYVALGFGGTTQWDALNKVVVITGVTTPTVETTTEMTTTTTVITTTETTTVIQTTSTETTTVQTTVQTTTEEATTTDVTTTAPVVVPSNEPSDEIVKVVRNDLEHALGTYSLGSYETAGRFKSNTMNQIMKNWDSLATTDLDRNYVASAKSLYYTINSFYSTLDSVYGNAEYPKRILSFGDIMRSYKADGNVIIDKFFKTRNAEEITAIVSELSQFSSKMASDIQYQYENS